MLDDVDEGDEEVVREVLVSLVLDDEEFLLVLDKDGGGGGDVDVDSNEEDDDSPPFTLVILGELLPLYVTRLVIFAWSCRANSEQQQ